jgi:NADH-quinone oxidoreductase subunit L
MILRRTQNGYVRSYALSLLGGALLVVLALLAVNFS